MARLRAPGAVLAAVLLAGCAPASAAPAISWARRFGDAGGADLASLVADRAGRSALLGKFQRTISFDAGHLTAPMDDQGTYVAMLDERGDPVWAHELGELPGNMHVQGLAGGAGVNTVVYGTFSGTLALAGTILGTIGFDGPPLDAPAGGSSAFVAKLDPAGGHVWSTLFGDGSATVTAITAVPDGDVVVAGTNNMDLTRLFATTGPFVAELGAEGEVVWQVQLSGDDFSQISSVAVDGQGSALVAGSFQGTLTSGSVLLHNDLDVPVGFVAKVSRFGELLWAHQLGDDATEARAVTTDAQGDVLLAGSYQGTLGVGAPLPARTQPGAYLATLDAEGGFRSSRGFGASPEASVIASIAVVGEDLVVGGGFQGTLDLDDQELVSDGASDVFIARLRP